MTSKNPKTFSERDVDADNAVWFAKHRAKYEFTAETSITVDPKNVDRAIYGHFIRAPFPKTRIARWGFLSATGRDAFCKKFKGEAK